MICVFPFCLHDTPRTLELLQWIRELGPQKSHTALFAADASVRWDDLSDLIQIARAVFGEVISVVSEQSVAGWPQGPNSLFLLAARYIEQNLKSPWFLCEPDCIPLKPDWMDQLEAEYLSLGKPFAGAVVICDKSHLPPVSLAGNAIYPANAHSLLSGIMEAKPAMAWDVASAEVSIPITAPTPLIHHFWGQKDLPPAFSFVRTEACPKNTFTLSMIHPRAVVFHRSKDGNLIRLLRYRKNPRMGCNCFLQMGRYGDIILLLPFLKAIMDSTGQRPVLVTSEQFCSVLTGVSYVEAVPTRFDWWRQIVPAIQWAKNEYGDVLVTQCHGIGWGVPMNQWPNFSLSMWDRAGFLSDFKTLPLVFDRRNPGREQSLCNSRLDKFRPTVLVNFSGISSPFPFVPEVMEMLRSFENRVTLLDLGKIRASQIYDLLGLYDHALGLITTDTVTLHLAQASRIPCVAFTVDGWCSSVPRGNCVLEIKYSQAPSRLRELKKVMQHWTHATPVH